MPDTSGWQTCQLYTFTIVTVYTRVLESRKNNGDDLETFNCLSFPCSRLTTKKDLTVILRFKDQTKQIPFHIFYATKADIPQSTELPGGENSALSFCDRPFVPDTTEPNTCRPSRTWTFAARSQRR